MLLCQNFHDMKITATNWLVCDEWNCTNKRHLYMFSKWDL